MAKRKPQTYSHLAIGKRQMSVVMSEALFSAIERLAADEERPMTRQVVVLIQEALKRREAA